MSAEFQIAIGLGVFMVLHILTGLHEWREAALGKLGLLPYRILFSLGVIASLSMITIGFTNRPFDVWWAVPTWAANLPLVLMPLSVLMFICHLIPTTDDNFTRQPIGWAIVIWALAHLASNGESGTTIFFGGFLLYGALAIYLRERKTSHGDTKASHGRDTPARLIVFTRWPSGLSGKKLAFIFATTILVTFVLIRLHSDYIGLSAIPTILE